MGYLATWLPIVSYCVEWATDWLSIVVSPLEPSDNNTNDLILNLTPENVTQHSRIE